MMNKLDDQILAGIGFSSYDDLKTFFLKLKTFFDTLTPTEQKVLRANMPTCEDAARTFTFQVSEAQLRAFIEAREPAASHFVCCIDGTDDNRHKGGGSK